MGERAVYSTMAHVFQIDQETKKKWLPSSSAAVKVAYYHDPARRTYRIIAIDNNKALVNSTITANMNFTKTSPKFGQWSDHRANTVYGLGFSSEKELMQFIERFNEAKEAAKELMKERQMATQRLQDQDKPHPPASSSLSPTSPPVKSPSAVSPPLVSSSSKSPSLSLTSSPGLHTSAGVTVERSSPDNPSPSGSNGEKEFQSGRKPSKEEIVLNGNQSPQLDQVKISNGHSSMGDHEPSPDGLLDSLKTENNRLKLALASSTTNVKKWESEMQTLKNNNTRLQMALEESKANVSQWKTQLQRYKEENDSLKKRLQQMENIKKKESIQTSEELTALQKENEELKEVLSAVQIDLEAKTEEVAQCIGIKESIEDELSRTKSRLHVMTEENKNLSSQVSILEDQFKMASVASKRKMEDAQERHKVLGTKLKDLIEFHKDLEGQLEA